MILPPRLVWTQKVWMLRLGSDSPPPTVVWTFWHKKFEIRNSISDKSISHTKPKPYVLKHEDQCKTKETVHKYKIHTFFFVNKLLWKRTFDPPPPNHMSIPFFEKRFGCATDPTMFGPDMRKVEILPQTDFWGFEISSK